MAVTTGEGDAQSEVSGVNSSRSSGSRKYRVVSRESKVDESLFASKTTTANRNNDYQREPARRAFAGDVPPNATVITEAELSKIKQRSVITTLADEEAARAERERVLQDKQYAARARKQRMLEVEVQAKQKAPKSDIETPAQQALCNRLMMERMGASSKVEQMARDHMVRKLAAEKMDANNDLVKMLNSLGARAAAFTIRDKQLAEKTRREEAEKAYEKRMDMIVELDRLKELTRRDAEEQSKKLKRVEDRKVITEQIEARQRAKLIELEAREQENRAMLAVTARYAEEDKAAAAKKAHEVRAARAEVIAANEAAIEMRNAAEQRKKQEVEAILAYQAAKDEEMRLREVAEAEKRAMMKARQQKLLEGQQRDMDKRAELDELRARRAAEEKERETRQREMSAAAKRKKDIEQLQVDRKRQAEMKKAQLAREADIERDEYETAVKRAVRARESVFNRNAHHDWAEVDIYHARYNTAMAQRDKAESNAKHAASMNHRDAILQQVQDAEAKRVADRAAKFAEGRRLKQEYCTERVKLEVIREKTIQDLEKKGISPKYLSEMKTVDINKLHMR